MASSDIDAILSFWFDHDHPDGIAKWFKPSSGVDQECQQWTHLVEAAHDGRLTAWTETPRGTLALLILLDQLPRNIYRGTPKAFGSDAQALSVALDAIAKGVDRQVDLKWQMFFYLPIMHQESLLAQVGCLGLYQGMLARAEADTPLQSLLRGALEMAQVHVDIIRRYGRYPGRNKSLGRESTREEIEFLEEKGPRGF